MARIKRKAPVYFDVLVNLTGDPEWQPPRGFVAKIIEAEAYFAKLEFRGFHCIKDFNDIFQYHPSLMQLTRKEVFPWVEKTIREYISEHSTSPELVEYAEAIRTERLEFRIEYVDK